MNSLHHNPSSLPSSVAAAAAAAAAASTTLQQAAAIIPTLTNQPNSLDPVSHCNSIPLSATLNSLTNAPNYPLEMECDPVSNTALPSSVSSSSAASLPHNTTNPTLLANSRYNFLLSGLSTSASSGALLNGGSSSVGGGSSGNITNTMIGNTSVGPLSGNHAHLHRSSKSASNVVQSFAPTSLPIGLYGGLSNNGGVVNTDPHSLAAYQHHLLATGGGVGGAIGPNGNITYIPYSMSSETVPKNSSTMTSSSSLSSS